MNASSSGPPFDWQALYDYYNNWPREPFPDNSPAGFWNSRAEKFVRKTQHPRHRELAEDLLNRFSWDPSERVLDVGSGPGSYALPLAHKVREVTALDVSSKMLEYLQDQAKAEGLSNIRSLRGYWLNADPAVISGYDTLICFNAVGAVAGRESGENDIVETILRFKKAAPRGILLIPHTHLPVDEEMRKMLDLPDSPVRRERVAMLHLIMVRQGLMPCIEILQRPFLWVFTSIEEGHERIGKRLGISDDPHRMGILRRLIQDKAQKSGDYLILQYPVAQSLFYWGF